MNLTAFITYGKGGFRSPDGVHGSSSHRTEVMPSWPWIRRVASITPGLPGVPCLTTTGGVGPGPHQNRDLLLGEVAAARDHARPRYTGGVLVAQQAEPAGRSHGSTSSRGR